jgi:hypothetical protein
MDRDFLNERDEKLQGKVVASIECGVRRVVDLAD